MTSDVPPWFFVESRRHMLGSIGMPELIIIFIIALIIFGPRKLPELGRSLGKSLAEFKKASNELKSTLEEEIRMEEQRSQLEATRTANAAAAAAAAATTTTTAPAAAPAPAPVAHVEEETVPVRRDHSA